MKRVYLVGLNRQEVECQRGELIHRRPELQADSRWLTPLTVDAVRSGALRGLRGDEVEVVIHERAWRHPWAWPFYAEVRVLEASGVSVTAMLDRRNR